MVTYTEGNLQITFPADAQVRKFDDSSSHGLPCMKAVDFIVEEEDKLWFIELKDPEHPSALERDRAKFVSKFKSGALDDDLKYKYRDTFLYEWASKRTSKPIQYCVLIGIEHLTEADLLARTEDLARKLPVHGPPSKVWRRSIVATCLVFNLAAWNRQLPQFPIARV
ncbi:MAG: hypothetical protein OXU36_19140 [Candidatus Poribacteria bacterium]|nr:hypothetical protein [Candidatus Poribacteria bacterium]